MLFQGSELAITQGGRSAHKVYFWITYSSHADRVWKRPLKLLYMVMNEANALGMSSIKYSHKWGWKCSRQQALEKAARKRYQTFRKLTQMEHKMPLRDTTEVQMKPCPAKTHYTKLQMDDRNISRGCSYLLPNFAKHAFKGSFPQQ